MRFRVRAAEPKRDLPRIQSLMTVFVSFHSGRSHSRRSLPRIKVGKVDQATARRPFFATSVKSFNDAPLGRFSPLSHWLTKLVVTLRYLAKTA